jgi:Interferon-inducible GTPase (IIGP)/Alanine-zipper, major outer membrane lipoprotein
MGLALSVFAISAFGALLGLSLVKDNVEPAQSSAERAQREAEQARRDSEQAQRDADRAQRDAQEARDRAQREGAARQEAERLEREARAREQEARQREAAAQRAREEAERAAQTWEEAVANAERARQARRTAEERLMRGVQQFRELHGYKNRALNIAVVGESGVGKSALLNSIRGLWSDDHGAAPVGINETTAEIQGYADPNHPQVQWFDVPGANTPNISGWLYFMDQHLYIFDALVILFSDRFTQTVGTLLSNAQRCTIPTFLVRTKADQLIQNLKNDRRGRRLDDAQAKQIVADSTREMVNQNLTMLNLLPQPVFVVSALGLREWVTEGDATNAIDEQLIYQTLVAEAAASHA